MRSATPDLSALLEQMLTLETLDRLPRTGFLQRGVSRAESVAEHSWHVATVAWTLLPYCCPLDEFRVLELALLHDVGEQIIGDLPRPAKRLFPKGAKETAEEIAMGEVLAASKGRAAVLASELRSGSSPEAQFVHQCDQLQLLLKTATYADWNEGASEQFFRDLTAETNAAFATHKDPPQFAIFGELRRALIQRRRNS